MNRAQAKPGAWQIPPKQQSLFCLGQFATYLHSEAAESPPPQNPGSNGKPPHNLGGGEAWLRASEGSTQTCHSLLFQKDLRRAGKSSIHHMPSLTWSPFLSLPLHHLHLHQGSNRDWKVARASAQKQSHVTTAHSSAYGQGEGAHWVSEL